MGRLVPLQHGVNSSGGGVVVLVAGVEDLPRLPESLRQCFTHEIKLSPPSDHERLATLRSCLGSGDDGDQDGGGGRVCHSRGVRLVTWTIRGVVY
jgi:hypothetical protein